MREYFPKNDEKNGAKIILCLSNKSVSVHARHLLFFVLSLKFEKKIRLINCWMKNIYPHNTEHTFQQTMGIRENIARSRERDWKKRNNQEQKLH